MRPRPTRLRAAVLPLLLAVFAATAVGCTAPAGASLGPSASDAMMEHSPAPSDAMMDHSPEPSPS